MGAPAPWKQSDTHRKERETHRCRKDMALLRLTTMMLTPKFVSRIADRGAVGRQHSTTGEDDESSTVSQGRRNRHRPAMRRQCSGGGFAFADGSRATAREDTRANAGARAQHDAGGTETHARNPIRRT